MSRFRFRALPIGLVVFAVATARHPLAIAMADAETAAPPEKIALAIKTMFVTSVAGSGDLSSWPQAAGATGIAAGDAICQNLAQNAGLAAPDTYRAWLSTASVDAYCHLFDLAAQMSNDCGQYPLPAGAGPWERPDGNPFAESIERMLATFDPQHDYLVYLPPRIDENGHVVHGDAWTGSSGGAYVDSTYTPACNGWKSASDTKFGATGASDDTGVFWEDFGESDCSQAHHLYCFQVGVGGALPTNAGSGRLAFVTTDHGEGVFFDWQGMSGQPSPGPQVADQICTMAAARANLPHPSSFKAWISDGNVDARDRFHNDGPIVRLDRVRVANSLSDLEDGFLRAPINVREDGIHDGGELVWTGTHADGTFDSACYAGWQSSIGQGTVGWSAAGDVYWTDAGVDPNQCNDENHLYCIDDIPYLFADGFESGDVRAWDAHQP